MSLFCKFQSMCYIKIYRNKLMLHYHLIVKLWVKEKWTNNKSETSHSSNWIMLLVLCTSASLVLVLWSVWSWFKAGKAWTDWPGNVGLWRITLSANCSLTAVYLVSVHCGSLDNGHLFFLYFIVPCIRCFLSFVVHLACFFFRSIYIRPIKVDLSWLFFSGLHIPMSCTYDLDVFCVLLLWIHILNLITLKWII